MTVALETINHNIIDKWTRKKHEKENEKTKD